jgi:hypothetical protein
MIKHVVGVCFGLLDGVKGGLLRFRGRYRLKTTRVSVCRGKPSLELARGLLAEARQILRRAVR